MRLGHKQSGLPGKHARKWAARSIFAGVRATISQTVRSLERISTAACYSTKIGSGPITWISLIRNRSPPCGAAIGATDFDLIVDDGLHTFDGGRCLFEYSFEKVRPSGLYVIEDVAMPDMRRFKRYFMERGIQADYINLLRPENGLRDNSLIAVWGQAAPKRVRLRIRKGGAFAITLGFAPKSRHSFHLRRSGPQGSPLTN